MKVTIEYIGCKDIVEHDIKGWHTTAHTMCYTFELTCGGTLIVHPRNTKSILINR